MDPVAAFWLPLHLSPDHPALPESVFLRAQIPYQYLLFLMTSMVFHSGFYRIHPDDYSGLNTLKFKEWKKSLPTTGVANFNAGVSNGGEIEEKLD